jgi:predicted ATPase
MFPSPSGEDLLSVLYQMKVEFEDEFEDLQDCLRTGFKHFKKIEFPSVAGGQITLSWHQTNLKKPIYINELSDGTLRFLFLVALLLSPSPPSMILLDEPEDGLHPSLVEIIRELLVQASRKTQIIVATHSSSLIRELEPKHVVVADFEDESESLHFRRASDLDLTEWLKKFTLDQLWQMGELGGRP